MVPNRQRLSDCCYQPPPTDWSKSKIAGLQAGVQITTVAVFDTDMSDIPLTVSVGLPASENAKKIPKPNFTIYQWPNFGFRISIYLSSGL